MTFTTALIMFGLITIVMLFIEINFTYLTQGFAHGFSSNRSTTSEYSPLARRIKNAYQNQVESAAYSVPILAVAAISGLQDSGAQTAALLFVIGRAAFAALYYSGIPFVRVPAFGLATLSIVYIAYILLTA